jgi:Lysophospholipase
MRIAAHDVPTDDGVTLRLWEWAASDPDAAVLFVHGATYASRSIFAPHEAADRSWMAWCADANMAAFAVDIRGYGDSDRPPEMAPDADPTEPPVRAATAAEDVRAALEAVHESVTCPVHLVGTSWGTMIAGTLLTSADAPEVASVTLHAPVFEPSLDGLEGVDLKDPAATRTVSRTEARRRWNGQVPVDPPAAIRGGDADSDPAFESFWTSLAESGQAVADEDAIRAPNGTLVDLATAGAGDHCYDPAAIAVPTHVVRGSLDPTATREDALRVYDTLAVPDDEATYTEIAGGTHFVHLERRRRALYESVYGFQVRQTR